MSSDRAVASRRGLAPRTRAALAYLVLFGGFGAVYPYAALYYLARGLDYAEIGAIISLGAIVALVAGPAWGAISDRRAGSPRVLLASAGVALAGVAFMSVAASFAAILAANIVIAVGFTGLTPIIDARALETVRDERANYGPVRAWGSVGYVASSLFTGFAIQAWGLGAMFVVLAAGLVLAAAIGLRLAPAVVTRADRPFRATLLVFRTPALLLFLTGMLFTAASLAAAVNFVALRFEELGAATGVIGIASALSAAVEVPVMLRFPSLARRFGGTRLLVAGTAFIALRSALASVAADPALLVVASGIGGIGYALFLVGGVTFVAEHVPAHLAATGQGIFQGVTLSLSQVVAAAAAGLAAGIVGIAGMFAIAAVVGAAATVVVAIAVLPRRPVRAESTP